MSQLVCRSFAPEQFGVCVESLKFRQDVVVWVRSAKEFDFASKVCGLKTMAPAELNLEVDFRLISSSDLGGEEGGGGPRVVWFEFDSLAQAQTNPALLSLLSPNQQSNTFALVRLARNVPSPLEACQFFAAFPQANNNLALFNSTLPNNSPFQVLDIVYTLPVEFEIGKLLQTRKKRIAILEASTGGLVAGKLLSVPGASSFFISGAVVYTARGAKRILPESVLNASALMDRERNYANKENYLASKHEYCQQVATLMLMEMKADLMLVESGTVGPDFRVPGVDQAFTVVGVAGKGGFYFAREIVLDNGSRDRSANMHRFVEFALDTLKLALEAQNKAQL
ncbi:hypothetical protein BASA81_003432 [Batrachochytrium salamandrivorans]|nr:hypothetical protein BASA81_003432 [Batrachochytrium salamandrivorans]